jgi:hypothetical protein
MTLTRHTFLGAFSVGLAGVVVAKPAAEAVIDPVIDKEPHGLE